MQSDRNGRAGVRLVVLGPVLGAVLLGLAGCASDATPELMHLRSSTNGPDEFAIMPPKALEVPEDLAALPEPTPGGANRTDQHPLADAIIALGGTPRANPDTGTGGVAASDSALFSHASRFGLAADIRRVLADEDLDFRRRNDGRLLERWFGVNVYFKAYASMSLDQQAELERWRQAGVPTPSAPPRLDGE